jgi:hypothetical protein
VIKILSPIVPTKSGAGNYSSDGTRICRVIMPVGDVNFMLMEDDKLYVWFDFAFKAEQASNDDNAAYDDRKLIASVP